MEARYRVTAIAPMDGAVLVLRIPLRNRRINTLYSEIRKAPANARIQNASGDDCVRFLGISLG